MNNDELLNIPFDQYQRYRVLKEIVEIIKNQMGNNTLKILDVGGHSMTMEGKPWLPVKEFLPEDKTSVVDIPACNIPAYIRGSGDKLPFKKDSFDIVTCQDVLEHIPAEKREEFIQNLIETGRDYIIIGFPFYSENAALAEKVFFEYIKNRIGGEHTHLKEHIVNGLPRGEDIEQLLVRNRISYSKIPSGYIYSWLLMNMIKVYISSIPDSLKLHSMIDRFYNMNFYESDQREPSYRSVIVISKNGNTTLLKNISKKFEELRERYKYFSLEKADFSLLQLLFNFENLENKNTINRLNEEVKKLNRILDDREITIRSLNRTVNDKENHIRNLDRMLVDIKGSKLWRLFDLTRKSEKGVKILIKEGPFYLIKKFINKINNKLNKEQVVYSVEDQFALWLTKNSLSMGDISQMKAEMKSFKYKPTISIIMPVYNVDKIWLEKAIDSVLNQIYPNWELCIADDCSTKGHVQKVLSHYQSKDSRIKVKYLPLNQGISLASNEAISLATGEFIALLDNDDELAVNAMYEVIKLLQVHPDTDMIYTDEDKITTEGKRCNPFFKPDWSPDLFLSQMYTCHLGIYRKRLIDDIGGFRKGVEGSQDYDLVLRFTEKTDKIFHIPKILYHWRIIPGSTATQYSAKSSDSASLKAISDALIRRSIKGTVEKGVHDSLFRVKRDMLIKPKVSIIIPTKDQFEILKGCIESIMKKTDYPNYEVVIVNNNSAQRNTIDYLNSLSINDNVKVLNYTKSFNFAAINNYAMSKIDSEIAVFLNNDTEVKSSEWLSSMLEHIQRKEVGAVGAKLLFPDGSIQHAGVVLGIGGIAGHAFKGLQSNINQSYFGHADAIRNYSAVTAACLMIRKSVFEELGGFDEINLPIAFNDIDLCLRLREKGYLIVYTPYAVLYHYESASRGYGLGPDPEADYMIKQWKDKLNNDPYYNINLTLHREDFGIRIET